MSDGTGGHVAVTRRQWDERLSAWFDRYAHSRWAAAEPYWGMWRIPQARLPVLPADLTGAAAVELGCGSAYVSAWLARRGARPVGVDVSARQLSTARRMQDEFGLRFPLIQADAERVPLAAGCAELVITEYGASVWCDPYRWVPEAARLLRLGGRLVFLGQSTLGASVPPTRGRPVIGWSGLFGLHRCAAGRSGTEYRLFALPHGEWIRLMGTCVGRGDLIEVQAPPDVTNTDFPDLRTSGPGAGRRGGLVRPAAGASPSTRPSVAVSGGAGVGESDIAASGSGELWPYRLAQETRVPAVFVE